MLSRAEWPREQSDNAFTAMLRRMYQSVSAIVGVALVDAQGECIDCVSSVEPYGIQLAAAHMHSVFTALRGLRCAERVGETHAFELLAASSEAWVRLLGDDYVLVTVLSHGFDRSLLLEVSDRVASEFRAEVGLNPPAWENRRPLDVMLRSSVRWDYAPKSYFVGGARVEISAVLGRWIEQLTLDSPARVCFRVRTEVGQELTLIHDERTERWQLRE